MSSPTHAVESALQISPPMEASPSLDNSLAIPIEAPTTKVQIEEALHDHELHDVAITMAEEKHDIHDNGDAHKKKKKHKHGHGHSHSASKEATKNTIKFIIMIGLVFIFFVAEIVMGYLGKSLALISDAFHMLSDGMSLVIGLVALRLSTKGPGKKLSYGWGRTEILGGLINGVFLLSVVLFVYMEAIQRFFSPEPIEKPYYVLGVGVLGLIVNIIGMIMFGGHHHHGHDHGHDHGHEHSHGHSHGHKKKNKKKDGKKKKHGDKHEHEEGHQHKHEDSDEHKHDHDHDEHHHEHEEGHKHDHVEHDKHGHDHKRDEEKGQKKKKKIVNLNMAGVFLHVLGDFLGSIGVVIAAALSWAFDPAKNRWVIYVDPSISVILNTIILFSTIPLVKNCAKVLLQIVPDEIDVTKLKEQIMAIKGVIDIHEFHIWKLVNTKVVCSIHVLVSKEDNFMILASKIKNILHEHSVHSSTIQPEFVDTSALKSPSEGSPTATMAAELCQLACSTDCQEDWCCPPSKEQKVPLLHDHDHH